MLTLAFEVLPKPGREGDYLDLAARLRPALDASGGMSFLDRSRSRSRPGWFLSHQVWLDEASMTRWRTHPAHHRTQACGRADILVDYRLRVAQVIARCERDTDRGTASPVVRSPNPAETAYRAPVAGDRARLMISIVSRGPIATDLSRAAVFDSVYDPSLVVTLAEVAEEASGLDILAEVALDARLIAARLAVVSRDYGMHERAEAPQYFDPVSVA